MGLEGAREEGSRVCAGGCHDGKLEDALWCCACEDVVAISHFPSRVKEETRVCAAQWIGLRGRRGAADVRIPLRLFVDYVGYEGTPIAGHSWKTRTVIPMGQRHVCGRSFGGHENT